MPVIFGSFKRFAKMCKEDAKIVTKNIKKECFQ